MFQRYFSIRQRKMGEHLMITLNLPAGLVLGARPYNTLTAVYHYAVSDGCFTVEQ
jgi:hypothetical protein